MSETLTDEEKEQARDIFAKIRIYEKEYDDKAKAGTLDKEFIKKAELQVKLQQAQFLARLYSEKLQDQLKVTPEEVDKYIADHPEISPAEKRIKAEGLLARAKSGEDFVALANEFSEDPGNKGPDGGTPQGGIYKDVPKGRMVPAFEAAALALEPGQVAPQLIETDFGFHIVKLERALSAGGKTAAKPAAGDDEEEAASGETYDVRHILISTGIKDEENPTGRDTPVKEYVQKKLESEKEKKILDDIVAKNNVSVPADFTVPEVTEEQMQQMRQRQPMPPQMPPDAEMDDAENAPPPAAKKPEAKK
jgi:parvulin-like peptidyl-prolyl isomerase